MISVGHCSAFVVAAEVDLDNVPRVGPVRVMVLFLCQTGNFGHERKSFCEVGKLKLFIKRSINFLPRFSHPLRIDGAKDERLFEWGVASDSAVHADT